MRLVVFDISGMAYATWKATGHKSINEMYTRVLAAVRAHLLGDKFDRVVIAVDAPGPKFRHDIAHYYKANRELPDEGYHAQLRDLIEVLDGDGCHVLRKDRYEADDIVASVVAWAREEGMVSVQIMSNDKDFASLVHDASGDQDTPVTLWRASRNEDGSVSSREWSETDVRQHWGVPSSKMRDFLALCGDTSDNVKGVEKVGPKTAAKLLGEYDDLEGITDAIINKATDFTANMATRLRESRDDDGLVAGTARKLVTLAGDALSPEECSVILTKKEPIDMTKNDEPEEKEEWPKVDPPAAPVATPEPAAEPSAPDAEFEEPQAEPDQDGPGAMVLHREVEFTQALEPRTPEEAWYITKHILNSRLFSAYGNREAILVTAMLGRSLGLDIMSALRGLHIIKGKPVMSAQLMLALIERSGKSQYFYPVESTDEIATYETHRVGQPKPVSMSWSMKDTHRAKLGINKQGNWDEYSNWAKYPRTMLRWRCVAELGRAIYPDVLSNCYTEEEKGEIR